MSQLEFKTAAAALSKVQREKLRLHLCSVCRAIGENYGVKARSCFRYDIVVLSILLHAVYDEQSFLCRGKCIKHPIKNCRFYQSGVSDYTAAMNIAVSYYETKNCRALKAKLQNRLLEKPMARIKKRFSLQCDAARAAYMKNGDCEAYAAMCGAMFAPFDDALSDDLRAFGEAFGRVLYVDTHRGSDTDKKLFNGAMRCAFQKLPINSADSDLLKALLFR